MISHSRHSLNLQICYPLDWVLCQQDRIMVSLTSLLVLTGLLTKTCESVPNTAYLKFIDIWYIVLIFIDFLIIVVLAVIEGLRERVRSGKVEVFKRNDFQWKQRPPVAWLPQTDDCLAKKLNAISIVVFPVMCVMFTVAFFAYGLSHF